MLDQLRSSAGSWVAKIFIGLLAASFAVWGINDVFRGPAGDALAQVGERPITTEEYRQAFDQQLRVYSRRFGQTITPQQARQLGLDRQVLADLLQGAALETQARTMQLAVPDKTVADRIASNKAFHNVGGEFNAEDFRRLLASNGMTEQQFVAGERQAMLRSAVSGVIDEAIAAPAPLVEAVWKYRNEQRDVRYFVVKADIAAIANPSEQELKAFYDANSGLFAVPEQRSFAIMVAEPEALGANTAIAEKDIEAEYERNKASYGTPEKRTIQQIPFPNADEAGKALDRIRGGADFLAVAKERGLTEADATLGERTRAQVPDPALAEAAFKLAEGTVSEPVAGRLSTVLLKVSKIVPGTEKTLAEAREQILRKLRHERGRDEVLNLYDRVEDARAGGQSFEEIARAENLKLSVIESAGRDGARAAGGAVQDFPEKDKVLQAVFESDVGVENDAASTASDGFVWYEIRDITPASVKPLDKVRTEAVEAWKKRKQRELALGKVEELKKRAEGGTPLDQLARESGAEVKTASGVKRNESSADLDAAAVQALFAVPADGFAVAAESDGTGAKIIQSSPVLGTPFDPAAADAKEIAEALEESLSGDLYAQYLAGLQNSIGVKLNEAEWSKLTAGRS